MSKRKLNDIFVTNKKPRVEPPELRSAATLKEFTESLTAFSDETSLNNIVNIIKQQLKSKNSGKISGNAEEWNSFIECGDILLNLVHQHKKKFENKEILHLGYGTIIAEILENVGELHCVLGGLSLVAYSIKNFIKVYENKAASFVLLSNIVDLATAIVKLEGKIEEEKLTKAITLLLEGSLMCVSQIELNKISSFFKTRVNEKELNKTSKMLHQLYRDLEFAITTKILKVQEENHSEIENSLSKNQSKIEKRLEQIEKRLEQIGKGLSEIPKPRAAGIENERVEKSMKANDMQRSNLTPSPATPIK